MQYGGKKVGDGDCETMVEGEGGWLNVVSKVFEGLVFSVFFLSRVTERWTRRYQPSLPKVRSVCLDRYLRGRYGKAFR